ncbi:hypothetical protein BDV95DRAFT_572805 [Massariosphaeria phaeospora]|uniref:Uncharacterized protein n=1 Tax=Massariosphaeria phaeospora TaxID=100035 RepID=A0A7C8MP98_9PLEO|nr:hypothetical protein BDV95DRAFT_572805 [Massariosphaeria phaeospora]
MRLSSTLAGLAVLATAATAQHIDIQPKELKGMVDGPWEGKKYTWEMMPAIPSLEKSYCTEPTDPHQVAQTTSQDGEPLVSDCQAMSLAVPEDTLWVCVLPR